MDACDAISNDANGVLEKFSFTGKEGLASDTVSGALGSNIVAAKPASLESTPQLEESDAIQFSMAGTKSESIVCTESTQCASKESVMKGSDGTKHSKAQKSQGKVKNSSTANKKLTNPRNVAAASAEKVKDGNEKQEQMTAHVSNGSFSSISHSKQSLASASNEGSSNRKQALEGDKSVDSSRATRLALAQSISLHSKPSTRTVLAASTTKVAQPDRLKEELKELKPLKQQSKNKGEEHSPSASLSPTAACPKPQRMGKIPSYGFSFKCGERAQKRKEFFSKLEEKIHAKEVEETTLQAKSKETQEAEIKLLRKSLTFKATPMPSFYQEPAPPKVEFKKIPTTRAKSPKLGRQKTSPMVSAEDSNHSRGSARMSLDERGTSKTGPAKESAPHVKKPLRKSLPKLPSERSKLVDSESLKTEPSKNYPEVEDPEAAEEICQTESKQDGPSVAAEVEPTEEEQSQTVQIAPFASSMESVGRTM